jgi:hypothetical protein
MNQAGMMNEPLRDQSRTNKFEVRDNDFDATNIQQLRQCVQMAF